MKFDIGFTVEVICNHYKEEELLEKNVALELKLNLETAPNIIFRFASNAFMINEYKVLMKYDALNNLTGVVLVREDGDVFIIKNINRFFADVTEGYVRTRTTEKILTIMEFDFETALKDSDDVVDEFDLPSNNF